MPLIAVLSNPNSNGNLRHLPRIRDYCDARGDILCVEVPSIAVLRPALERIAAARPDVLVINGGDGTIQAVLTEIHAGAWPERKLPPIAVLPGGRTNLIAKDLGAIGDPLQALKRVVAIAEDGIADNLSSRQLISLSTGSGERSTVGMFLAAGALADTMLWCRHRLYAMGMPTWLAHFLTLIAGIVSVLTNSAASFLPPPPQDSALSVGGRQMRGRYQVLMVSTLQALVLWGKAPAAWPGTLCLISLKRSRRAAVGAVWAALTGQLGKVAVPGLAFTPGKEIRLAEGLNNVIMDGESFTARAGEAIVLKPTESMCFVDLRSRARVSLPVPGERPAYGPALPEAAALSRLSDARPQTRRM